ncbi:MAG: hypothetical protein WDZ91_08085 [Paenibacillaceae bacterium]
MNRTFEIIVQEARQFIFNLCECTDDQVFQATTLEELGKYYYQKTLQNVDGLTDELLKDLIKSIKFKRNEPQGVNAYYNAICNMVFIYKVPGLILTVVQKKYNDIFVTSYNRVKAKIETTRLNLDQQIVDNNNRNAQIKAMAESVCRGAFVKNIDADYATIKQLAFDLRVLETDRELVVKNGDLLDKRFLEYCDIQDPAAIEQALRKTALYLAKERDGSPNDAEFVFLPYRMLLEAIEDNVLRPFALFYKVKFIPFVDEFTEEYWIASYRDENKAVKDFKAKCEVLPQIDDLYQLKQRDSDEYLHQLLSLISSYNVVNRIADIISSSPSLYNRRNILEKTLALYKNDEFELFANIAPVQIEGIITDYLYDEMTFRRFTDLNIYPKAVLREKITFLENHGSNVPTDAVLYFYYSFNNVIRNNIAHGAFENLYHDDRQAKIFSAETLMDMLYIMHVISRNSETEKMRRFIHGYIKYYRKVIKSETGHQHFGALLNDLIGNKITTNCGAIERYRPLQIVYWILNPTYEKIYETVEDKIDLLELRESLLSKAFWEYVLSRLEEVVNTGYDYLNIKQEFYSIVKGLCTCGVESETKQLLGKVNAELTKIQSFT